MKKFEPVFIIGCPRSGTTMFLRAMAGHEAYAWVSNYQNRMPSMPAVSGLNRIYGLEVARRLRSRQWRDSRVLPRPVEPWIFWNHYIEAFTLTRFGDRPPEIRQEHEIRSEEVRRVRGAVAAIRRWHGKGRFLSKYTDFPRVRLIRRAFPHAKFIHLVRDARAVVNSYCNKIAGGEFGTWREREWWMRGWSPSLRTKFEESRETPGRFVTCQWHYFVSLIEQELRRIPKADHLKVQYQEFVEEPSKVMQKILDFTGDRFSDQFAEYLESVSLENRNYKWRGQLGPEVIELIGQLCSGNWSTVS